MLVERLKRGVWLTTVFAVLAGCCERAYSQTNEWPLTLDIPSLFSNAPNSAIEKSMADENRKLDLSEALKIRRPDGFRPSESFAPPSMSPPRYTQPMINRQKVMELMHRQKEWVFLEPNEAEFGLTAEDIFKLREHDPEKSEEMELSPLARFYHRLAERERGQTDTSSSESENNPDREDEFGTQSYRFENLWSSSRGLGDSQFHQPASVAAFDQIDRDFIYPLGGGGMRPGKTDLKAEEERLRLKEARAEQFKRMLDSNFAITGSDSPSPLPGAGSWYNSSDPWQFPSSRSAPGFGVPQVSSPASASSAFSPMPSASGLPTGLPGVQDPSLPAGYPSLSPAPPPVEDRRFDMPQPVFSMPKRKM